MTRIFLVPLLYLLFFIAIFLPTQAEEYLIGVEDVNYYPLYNFSSHTVKNPSFTRDLLAKFFDSHQLKYRFVALPIKRFDRWYIDQDIDFKFPDNYRWRINSKHKLNIIYSEPVLELEAGTYVLKNNRGVQRKGIRKLVTVLGFYPTLWFDEIHNKQIELHEETAPLSIVKHILYGNADGTNIDSNVIRSHLKTIDQDNQIVLATNIRHEKYYYHLSTIKHPEIIKSFNDFIKHNQDFIEHLKQKYDIQE